MFLTAEEAGEFVAKFIDKSWPNDKESVFQILDLAQSEIYKTGLFSGSTKWFYTKVLDDNTIITPHGYSKLLGLKIGCSLAEIKDQFWMFHENGPASEPECSNIYTNVVQHLGDFPTLFNHYKEAKEKCCKSGFRIGVVSCNSPSYLTPPLTRINALDKEGKPVYTYPSGLESRVATDDEVEQYEKMQNQGDYMYVESDIMQGVQVPVTSKFISTPKDLVFSEIVNIAKDPTMARVEYYAIPEGEQHGFLIASLEPFQTSSCYSIYKIKNSCVKDKCCLGLFKVSPPERIVSDNQFMIISDKTVLLDFCKYVHKKYYKEDYQGAGLFLSSGVASLSAQLKAETPNKTKTLRVSSVRKTDSRNQKGGRKYAW